LFAGSQQFGHFPLQDLQSLLDLARFAACGRSPLAFGASLGFPTPVAFRAPLTFRSPFAFGASLAFGASPRFGFAGHRFRFLHQVAGLLLPALTFQSRRFFAKLGCLLSHFRPFAFVGGRLSGGEGHTDTQ
jgi:hypothetical protein